MKRQVAKTHDLKCDTRFFELVASQQKTFEIRKNDRGYKVGDELLLREWDNADQTYAGRSVTAEITYIFKNDDGFNFLQENYICMGINVYQWEDYGHNKS